MKKGYCYNKKTNKKIIAIIVVNTFGNSVDFNKKDLVNRYFLHKNDSYESSNGKKKYLRYSSENFASTLESSAGLGQMGLKDANKGGYGDDLYGTGAIFGQMGQQGLEMQQQPRPQRNFSGLSEFMNLVEQDRGIRFNLDERQEQKLYNGKMNMGGQILDIDDVMLQELIAAGADIEII